MIAAKHVIALKNAKLVQKIEYFLIALAQTDFSSKIKQPMFKM
jgi:hypothetical protein